MIIVILIVIGFTGIVIGVVFVDPMIQDSRHNDLLGKEEEMLVLILKIAQNHTDSEARNEYEAVRQLYLSHIAEKGIPTDGAFNPKRITKLRGPDSFPDLSPKT